MNLKDHRCQSCHERLVVTNVHFSKADASLQKTGLIGWISCEVNSSLKLDGITLRRTQDGRHVLSFPAKTDHRKKRFLITPLNNAARMDIEQQIISALVKKEGIMQTKHC